MPSAWTFTLRPVQQLLAKYNAGAGWIDPFAGYNSPAEITNDIDPSRPTIHHMDALEFLTLLPDESASGALFDPPYSVEQCLRRYTPRQGGTAGRAEYWARCKDQIARILRPGAIAVSFAWDSTGVGKARGFSLIEIKLLCHGACHNDTIITIEKKLHTPVQLAFSMQHNTREE